MTRSRLHPGVAALLLAPLLVPHAASAHGIVGDRFFPATIATDDPFAADELAFVSGGPEVGRAFAALPFDHLIFTGATSIGKHILHAAADNLVPVTLELGGKSPVIVGRSADVPRATEFIALSRSCPTFKVGNRMPMPRSNPSITT